MEAGSAELDTVFAALADPTRRKIIETVREKDCTVAELSALFAISAPAVTKHLKVLDKAQLLQREKSGKYIICRYNSKPMQEIVQWMAEQHLFWKESFAGLKDFLDTDSTTENGK